MSAFPSSPRFSRRTCQLITPISRAYITPFNRAFDDSRHYAAPQSADCAGRAALDSIVTLQATIIAYIDDFKLLMILSLVVTPLALLLRRPAASSPIDPGAVME